MNDSLAYSVEREYPHPVSALWNAWTDAAALEQWYHPDQLAVLPGSVQSNATVGGLWTAAIDVPMRDMAAYFYGEYTEVVVDTRLAHTMHYTESAAEFEACDMTTPEHLVVVDFEVRGDNTWVRFSQFGEMPAQMAEGAKAGMESYFDSLGAYLG